MATGAGREEGTAVEAEEHVLREGIPWPERIARARAAAQAPGTNGPRQVAASTIEADLVAWREAVDPDHAGLFERRLQWDGLDEAAARRVLSGAGDHPARPDWLSELRSLRAAGAAATHEPAPDELGATAAEPAAATDDVAAKTAEAVADRPADPALRDIPFDRLLSPMVRDAWNRLARDLDPRWLAPLSPTARESLRRDLGRRLSTVTAQACYADFTRSRTPGATVSLRLGVGISHPPDDAFRQWCRSQCADGLSQLLERCPVLGRVMATAALQWRGATTEMLHRLHCERQVLAARLGVPVDANVADVEIGLSDHHRGGRSVCVLRFGTGDAETSLVYKPKDCRIEAQFQAVVAMVNAWFGDRPLTEIDVVAGEGYGFTSYVDRRIPAPADLPDFYVAAGRMLALLYLLGATDVHCENLTATGSSLALLDPETMFHSDPVGLGTHDEHSEDGDTLADTVLRTGMLPGWSLAGPEQSAYDPSALGVESMPDGTPQSGWVNVNTDAMLWTAYQAPRQAPLSLPVEAGEPNPLAEYVEQLVAGFREVHTACRDETFRARVLDLIAGFRGLPRRIVLRSTRVYELVQRKALSAGAVSSGNHRGVQLERLARSSLVAGRRDPRWAVFRAELYDMENLDVPHFEQLLGAPEVYGALGPIPAAVESDGLAAAARRVARVDDDDLAWQLRLLRGAVRARFVVVDRAPAPGPHSSRAASPDVSPQPVNQLEAAAEDAARTILAQLGSAALTRGPGDSPTWLTLSLLPDGRHARLGTVSGGWYDGRAGISAVQQLAWDLGFGASGHHQGTAATSPDHHAAAGASLGGQAAATLAPILDVLQHPDPYVPLRYFRSMGLGFSGMGGVVRLLRMPCSDPELRRARRTTLNRLLAGVPAGFLRRDRILDVVGGVAGLILPLAQFSRDKSDPHAAQLLAVAAEHLAAAQTDDGGWRTPLSDRPLTGLAHGAAGAGLALLAAGTAASREDWAQAGAAAFRYEARCYDAHEQNWPDLRHRPGAAAPPPAEQFMTAWCHGAAGIGLTRMHALRLLATHTDAARWQDDLERAMHTVATAPDPGTDHLCCGLTGRAAILRIAGRDQGRPDWLEASDALTRVTLARLERMGRPALPLDDPGSGDTISPGLMTGLAGVAAHLMTRSRGEDLGLFLV